MRAKYRTLRALGMDPFNSFWIAFVSCAIQPDDTITILSLDIEVLNANPR